MGTRNEELQRNKNIADTLAKQDEIMEKLDDVANGQANILRQLRLTHIGNEIELWGREIDFGEELREEELAEGIEVE